MNEQTYSDIRQSATDQLAEEMADTPAHRRRQVAEILETRAEQIVKERMEAGTRDGRVILLTDEELRCVRSLRRFKSKCKAGECFKWQTRAQEPVIVEADQLALVCDPQDVSER